MRQDPNCSAVELRYREQRLHLALADRGQQIVSRYLDGEQENLRKPDFDKCARYFRTRPSAWRPPRGYDQSRALFCHGRALIDKQFLNQTPDERAAIRFEDLFQFSRRGERLAVRQCILLFCLPL
jgi:hypothetical protein